MKDNIKIIKPLSSSFIGIDKSLKKGIVKFPGCDHNIRPALKSKGGYVTGLDFKIDNPEFISEKETPNVPKEIVYSEYLEQKLGLEKGTLSPTSKYWEDYKVKIHGDKSTLFNMDNPEEAIAYYVASADEIVALGEDRESLIKKPKAKYYTLDEERLAKEKKVIRELRRQADDIIRSATVETKRKYARLLGANQFADSSVSEEILDAYLDEIVNSNPQRILDLSKQTATSISVKSEILEFLEYGVLVKRDGRIHRLEGNEIGQDLGADVNQVAKFLENPKNQDIRAALKTALVNKKIKTEA